MLVLEQSRVEVAVLLNELAYLKYEAPKDTSATAEAILLKRRNVAVAYSLIERIIKLISNVDGNDGIQLEHLCSFSSYPRKEVIALVFNLFFFFAPNYVNVG